MSTWRRRFVRLLGWWIGAFASVVAVALLLLAAYLLFFDYSESLRVRLEEELTRIAGSRARVGSINLNWTGYAFELNDITVDSPDGDPRALLRLDRVWGRLRVSEIARLRLHWTELVVQGLSLRLVEGAEGGISLPHDVSPPSLTGAPGISLSADRVSLEDAELLLSNEKVPWTLEADRLDIELTRAAGTDYRGTLRYDDGVLRIKDHPGVIGSLEAELELSAGELFVHEARGASELGTVTAKGKLSLAGGVHGRFDVEAEGDAQRGAASLFGVTLADDTLSGTVQFRGLLTVSPETKQLEGTAEWPRGRLLGLSMAAWAGDVFWDRQLLQLSLAEGRIGSGRARLQIHQVLPAPDHPASVELEFEQVSLADAVSGLRGRPSPVSSNVSGLASLSFQSRDPARINGTFALRGTPDTTGAGEPVGSIVAGEPIGFTVDGSVSDGDVEITNAQFETATMTGTLSGLYPQKGSAELVVDVVSTDLARTDAVARAVRRWLRPDAESDPELWGIAGRGRARGRLVERLPHPTFEGQVSAAVLELDGIEVQDLQSRAVFSRSRLDFEDLLARRGSGVVVGVGMLSLDGPIGSRGFDLNLRFSDWPASDLATLVDGPLRVGGRMTGDLEVRRLADELGGSSRVDVAEPELLGQRFDRGEARVVFVGQKVRLENASLSRGSARIEGSLELDVQTGGIFGQLATAGFPLAGTDFAGVRPEGTLVARATIDGRAASPMVALEGEARELTIDGIALGDAALTASLGDDVLELDAQFGPSLSVEAVAGLGNAIPLEGTVRFDDLDAGPWLARVSESFSDAVRVLTTGSARFEVELENRDNLNVNGTLERVVVERDPVRFESLAPVELQYRDGTLTLPSLSLAERDSRVVVGGTIDVPEKTLDLRAEGMAALDILEAFYPSIAASGDVDLSARVTGGWDRPALSGHADLHGSSLRFEGFPQALGDLRGRLVFDNRTIRVPKLEGVFGSGPVSFSGAVSLDGFAAASIDLQAKGEGMRLRYPEGLVATIDADLALLGGSEQQVLSGEVVLTDATWTREYDLVAGILTDSEGVALFDRFEGDELLGDVRFDVRIRAPESLRLRNSLAEIDASAELELRGSLAEPVLLGSTEAERGEVYFLGQVYDITAGKIDFVDPTKVEPFVELTAETRVRSYRVELRLTGTADRFFPELSSDPPLRTVDILRLLSGANERDILIGTEEEELAGVGVASLLTERLSHEVGRRAERLFGLDRFSIDPFLVGRIANPTARVSLGKRITRDLTINYSTNLNSTTEAIILIEYTPEGNMSWILSRDEEGDVGIDVKFRKSF